MAKFDALNSDCSFHNNTNILENWMKKLKDVDRSQTLKSILSVAEQMLNPLPQARLYSWEAELDLYNILHSDEIRLEKLERGALCVQRPAEHRKFLMNVQSPVHRAVMREDKERLNQLLKMGWPATIPDHDGMTAAQLIASSKNLQFRHAFKSLLASEVNNGTAHFNVHFFLKT